MSVLEYTLRHVVDYKRRRLVKDMISNRVMDAIDASAGRVSLASSSMELLATTPLELRVARSRVAPR